MGKLDFLMNELAPYLNGKQASAQSRAMQYKKPDAFLFAVHGTISSPATWNGTQRVLHETCRYFGFDPVKCNIDTSFSWAVNMKGEPVDPDSLSSLCYQLNGPTERAVAAMYLGNHIYDTYRQHFPSAIQSMDEGNYDPIVEVLKNHPIILIAHSHGGNVCIQLLSRLMGIPAKVYLCTLATPTYDQPQLLGNSIENPKKYKSAIKEHAHFFTPSDAVQGVLAGYKMYTNSFTQNHSVLTHVGHSFHNKTPDFLADCIAYFRSHKSLTKADNAMLRTLKKRYPNEFANQYDPDRPKSGGSKPNYDERLIIGPKY